jgi:hypothetical protein
MHCCWSCPWPLGTCATAISTSMASDTDRPSLEHAGRGCMAVIWRGVVLRSMRTCAGDLCTGQGKESLSAFPHQQKHTAAFSRVNTTSPKLCCTLLPCSQSYHAVHVCRCVHNSNCCLLPVPLPAEKGRHTTKVDRKIVLQPVRVSAIRNCHGLHVTNLNQGFNLNNDPFVSSPRLSTDC